MAEANKGQLQNNQQIQPLNGLQTATNYFNDHNKSHNKNKNKNNNNNTYTKIAESKTDLCHDNTTAQKFKPTQQSAVPTLDRPAFILNTDQKRIIIIDGFIRKLPIYIPKEINEIITMYLKDGIYVILYHKKPLGFAVIMDPRGKNAIISSIHDENNYKLGMKIASRIIAVNNTTVENMKHKKILKIMSKVETPFYLTFIKSQKRINSIKKENKRLRLIQEYERKQNYYNASDLISLTDNLTDFDKVEIYAMAVIGELFLKYNRNKKEARKVIVKMAFDKNDEPKQIIWGSGSRHIDCKDILYIAWGHWTPTFVNRTDMVKLDPKLCLSVVGKGKILNIVSANKLTTELWVKGLRELIGHSDEKSDKLAKQALESWPESNRVQHDLKSEDSYSSSDDEAHVAHHHNQKNISSSKKIKSKNRFNV